jgi:hypothetical protein
LIFTVYAFFIRSCNFNETVRGGAKEITNCPINYFKSVDVPQLSTEQKLERQAVLPSHNSRD